MARGGIGLAVLRLRGFLFGLQYRAEHDSRWHGRQATGCRPLTIEIRDDNHGLKNRPPAVELPGSPDCVFRAKRQRQKAAVP